MLRTLIRLPIISALICLSPLNAGAQSHCTVWQGTTIGEGVPTGEAAVAIASPNAKEIQGVMVFYLPEELGVGRKISPKLSEGNLRHYFVGKRNAASNTYRCTDLGVDVSHYSYLPLDSYRGQRLGTFEISLDNRANRLSGVFETSAIDGSKPVLRKTKFVLTKLSIAKPGDQTSWDSLFGTSRPNLRAVGYKHQSNAVFPDQKIENFLSGKTQVFNGYDAF